MNPNIKTYTTSKARVCLVNVPEISKDFRVNTLYGKCHLLYGYKFSTISEEIPFGLWQPLPLRLSEVSEDQAAALFDQPFKDVECRTVYSAFMNGEGSFSHHAKLLLIELARSLNIPEDQDPVVLVEFKK